MPMEMIIPKLIQWLVGQGVPEEQAIASIQQA